MSAFIHVFGTANIYTGTGSVGALEQLGVSQDGVKITLDTHFDPVHTDHYGKMTPYDYQYLLQEATITCELIWYDAAVFAKFISGVPNEPIAAAGVFGSAGDLVIQNSLYARLLIKSTPTSTGLTSVETCYNFPRAILVDQSSVKVGVEKNVWNLTFKGLPNQQASGSAGSVIFNSVCT